MRSQLCVIVFMVIFVSVSFGQSEPVKVSASLTPSPTPSPVSKLKVSSPDRVSAIDGPSAAQETQGPGSRIVLSSERSESEKEESAEVKASPSPTPTPESAPAPKKGWSVNGGLDVVSRYHGGNGERFGGADQNVWLEAEYRFKANLSAYCGTWYAIQFKELDVYCGLRVKTGRLQHTLQFQNLYLFTNSGAIKVSNPSYEISVPLVERKRFSASAFARVEYYFTQKEDNLRPGAYFIAGVTSNTDLGRNVNLNAAFKVVNDHKGAFNTNKGLVVFVYGSVKKSWGRFSTGPTFKFSTDWTTGNRPTLATVGWSFSY